MITVKTMRIRGGHGGALPSEDNLRNQQLYCQNSNMNASWDAYALQFDALSKPHSREDLCAYRLRADCPCSYST